MDAIGNPLKLILTAGQRHDSTQAKSRIEPFDFDHVIADKAYDSDPILAAIADKDAMAVIPSSARRNQQREHDEHLYKERHLVECFINKIKWYRRIFTRYDKLDRRYMAFLHLACTMVWLR